MEPIEEQAEEVTVNFRYFIQMAVEKKMAWSTLSYLLTDLAATPVKSKQVIKLLLQELEKWITKEDHKPIKENQLLESSSQIIETVDDEIEVLEVVKERFDEATFSEFYVGTKSSCTSKFDSNNYDPNNSDTEIDNEWYTFISNDKQCVEENNFSIEKEQSDNFKKEEKPDEVDKIGTISENKQFQCQTCQKSFQEARNLKRHIGIHSGEEPYECNTCKKRFKQSTNLKVHERIHTGEVPYECKECNKRFKQKSKLKIHERIHTGEKPYECKTCFRSFSQSNALQAHQRIHTGEKPYECKTCNERFKQRCNLKVHERKHHTV